VCRNLQGGTGKITQPLRKLLAFLTKEKGKFYNKGETDSERALYFFGGAPREVLYANMQSVVTDRDRYGPGLHRYNRTFLDFAHHHGFVPRLCQPYRPRTKGRVERFIRYLRASFYVPLASQLIPEERSRDRQRTGRELVARGRIGDPSYAM
jgi:transposase